MTLSCAIHLVAQESASNTPLPVMGHQDQQHRPWVGFEVTRADDVVRAQLPNLPKGVGFVIKSVDAQGPAQQAGLHALDVVWKWNDQWLINEAQLSTLIQLHQVGDQVNLSLFRSGKEMSLAVTLGATPNTAADKKPNAKQASDAALASVMNSIPAVTLNSRMARLEDGQAILEMEQRHDGTSLCIIDSKGQAVFDGSFTAESINNIPAQWHDRIAALQRTLQQTSSAPAISSPRPRVIAPARPLASPR